MLKVRNRLCVNTHAFLNIFVAVVVLRIPSYSLSRHFLVEEEFGVAEIKVVRALKEFESFDQLKYGMNA